MLSEKVLVMQRIGQVLSILLVAALTVFVVQNLEVVQLRFLVWKTELSLAFPIAIGYVLGSLTGRPIWRLVRRQRTIKRLEKKAEKKAAQAAREEQEASSRRPE